MTLKPLQAVAVDCPAIARFHRFAVTQLQPTLGSRKADSRIFIRRFGRLKISPADHLPAPFAVACEGGWLLTMSTSYFNKFVPDKKKTGTRNVSTTPYAKWHSTNNQLII